MKNISFFQAILFVINTIIGSGIFINSIFLINNLGPYSFIIYPITAIIMLPIVIICISLGKYFYGKNLQEIYSSINPKIGEIAAWTYSVSKLSTTAIAYIFSSRLLSKLLSKLFFKNVNILNTSILNINILFYFIFLAFILLSIKLNYNNFKLNKKLQILVFICKLFPMLLIIYYGLFKSEFTNIFDEPDIYKILSSIVITIFSFSGFESIFAIASNVTSPGKNTKKIIAYGFLSTIIFYSFYEFSICRNIFCNLTNFKIDFFDLSLIFFEKCKLNVYIHSIFIICISISVFGLGYSILYANIRNIFYLFEDKINKNTICYKIAILMLVYCVLFNNKIFYLQQCAALATINTYLLLCYVYKKIFFNKFLISKIITLCSCFTAIIFLISIIFSSINFGIDGYILYLSILIASKFFF